VAPFAVPNTTSSPPLAMVVPLAVPPETTYCSPPLDTVVPVTVPNTTWRPLLTMVPLSEPLA
jgi:hypothetical protein